MMCSRMQRTPLTPLERHMYDMKMSVKEMNAVSKKLQRVAFIERTKCKQCMKRESELKARRHAENVVRYLIASTNYDRTIARVEGLVHYFENAIHQRNQLENMEAIAEYMQQVLKVRDIKRAALVMDMFEKEHENLDVLAASQAVMVRSPSLPVATMSDVEAMLREISEEAQLEIKQKGGNSASISSLSSRSSLSFSATSLDSELNRTLSEIRR